MVVRVNASAHELVCLCMFKRPLRGYNKMKLSDDVLFAAPENLPGYTLWLPFFGVFAMGHSSSPHPDAHSLHADTTPYTVKKI